MSNYFEIKKQQGVIEAYSLPDLIAGIKEALEQGLSLGDPNATVRAGNFYQVPLAEKVEPEKGEVYLTRQALSNELDKLGSKNKVEQFARVNYKLDVDRSNKINEMKTEILEFAFPSPRVPFTEMVTVGEQVDWFTEEEKESFDEWAAGIGIKLDGRKTFENMKKQFWEVYNEKITDLEESEEEETSEESQQEEESSEETKTSDEHKSEE